MGLDMFLEGRKFFWHKWDDPDSGPLEDGYRVKEHILELGYWRKHPNLHGYIVQNFAGGEDNCQPVQLSQDDMVMLIQAVKNRELPKTEGFFFGESSGSEEEVGEDLSILTKALLWLQTEEEGCARSVVYCASW